MYLSHGEYTELGGQSTCATAYNRLEYKARKLVDQYTFGRLKSVSECPEAVKRLVLELVDLYDAEGENTVTSTSNAGYSESYAVVDYPKKAEELIYSYLSTETTEDGTPLLYQGAG